MNTYKIVSSNSGSVSDAPIATSPYRPDIQGLRAFAVTVVILNHLTAWPRGGFVGVDMFLVISGFVITESLFREHRKYGKISLRDFYLRRVRRILPAALSTMLVTLIASFFIFNHIRFISILWDALSASLFAANWRFQILGNDYFASAGLISPLQHFWSLSIEEQFYFVWPFVLLIIFVFSRKSPNRRVIARKAAALLIILAIIASLAWSLHKTSTDPSQAYFSTLARVWELGAGVLISIASPSFVKIPLIARRLLAWGGLAIMSASVFIVDPARLFPAPMAILPVAAISAVIISGIGLESHEKLHLFPLTNRVSIYLGNISYSLYLWHFPIIIIFLQFLPSTPSTWVFASLSILLISIYAYHNIEDPIRKSQRLTLKSVSKTKLSKLAILRSSALTLGTFGAVIGLFLTAGAVPQITVKPNSTSVAAAGSAGDEYFKMPSQEPEVEEIQQEIDLALSATDWPELSPTMEDAIGGEQAPAEFKTCGTSPTFVDELCTFGSPQGTRNIYIVGDSVSMTYAPIIAEIIKDRPEWSLKVYGVFGCTFTKQLITSAGASGYCADRKMAAIRAIEENQPDILVVSNTYEPRTPVGSNQALSPKQWSAETEDYLARVRDYVTKMVMIAPPPSDVNIGNCYTKLSKPKDCLSHVTSQWSSVAKEERLIAESLDAVYIDTVSWFCSPTGSCPAFIGTIPTKMDQVHMTPAYAMKLVPIARRAFLNENIFGR